jgi:ribosomal-protein-alanine N-acetyltransferase
LNQVILESERLILRYQQVTDVPFLVDLWANEEVTRYMGGPRDKARLQSVFEETAQDPLAERYDLWPVVEKASGGLVGHCGLLDKEVDGVLEIELNYIFHPSAWGKGYAVEIARALQDHAFQHLGLPRLIALIDPKNEASCRAALRSGMHLEKDVIRPGGALKQVFVIENGALRP